MKILFFSLLLLMITHQDDGCDPQPQRRCREVEVCTRQFICEIEPEPESEPEPEVCSCALEYEGCCTLTQGGWQSRCLGNGNHVPAAECQIVLCGSTLLEILLDNSVQGNALLSLAHQYVASYLNINVKHACLPANVEESFNFATTFLEGHCGQFIDANSEIGQEILVHKTVLDDYNNGIHGPGHCE